jgi:hypothetical protein
MAGRVGFEKQFPNSIVTQEVFAFKRRVGVMEIGGISVKGSTLR